MGDLKVGESFEDRVYITDSTGAAKTGLAPTCTVIDESGNRTAGTVEEMASGWYKVTDFTPDAAGTWCLEWAVSGTYTIQYPNKLFKVGGGVIGDLQTESEKWFVLQDDQVITQATPTQNQWYTVMDTTTGMLKIHAFSLTVLTTNETLEAKFTMDGREVIVSQAAVANTDYYGYLKNSTYLGLTATDIRPTKAPMLECKSVKVEVRKTTASGTGSLVSRVVWYKKM